MNPTNTISGRRMSGLSPAVALALALASAPAVADDAQRAAAAMALYDQGLAAMVRARA